MGAIYRRKRRSCGLCKPNKTGHAPARTPKEAAAESMAAREIRDATRVVRGGGGVAHETKPRNRP